MSRRPAQRSACLGPVAVDYVHGTLSPSRQLEAERHLVVCVPCRNAVDDERRLDASLRAIAPTVPRDLQAMLMSLAPERGSGTSGVRPTPRVGAADRPAVPAVPTPPASVGGLTGSLPVVDVRAPAQHRSAMRSAICAGLAAGASAAAAWSIGVVGAPVLPTAPAVSGGSATPVHRQLPSGSGGLRSPGSRTALATFSVPEAAMVRPAVSTGPLRSAQSTP